MASAVLIVSGKDKTLEERNNEMIKLMEDHFKTGPIIGEARELLEYMSTNIYVRDLILDSFGMDEHKRKSYFDSVMKLIEEKDEEILAARKANKSL